MFDRFSKHIFLRKLFAKKLNLAYSLRGGGAKAVSYLGAFEVLEQNNIKPDILIGASGGALIAVCYAMGKSKEEVFEISNQINIKNLLGINSIRNQTLADQQKVLQILKQFFGEGNLEDLPVKTLIQATDAKTFDPVIFSNGKIIDCLMASISLPLLLPAYKYNENYYIDGDMSQAFEVEKLKNFGAHIVLGFSVSEIHAYDNGDASTQSITDALQLFGCTTLNLQRKDLIIEPVDVLLENCAGRVVGF
jgi:NTE family protein